MICPMCYSPYETLEDINCPTCGNNPSCTIEIYQNQKKLEDAKTLGFTEAKLLYEAPSFEKAGSIFRK